MGIWIKQATLGILLIFPFFLVANVQDALLQIPEKDREVLEIFFQHLIQKNPFGYTLFGEKPMSIACYSDPLHSVGKELNTSLLMEKGWKVWTCYKDLFSTTRFIMKREEGEKEIFKTNTICLINKPAAVKAISENLDLFRQEFGGQLTPDEILEKLCDPAEKIFHGHHLFGILLGFGRHNAVIFHEWRNLIDQLTATSPPPFLPQHKEHDQIDPENQQFLRHLPTKWQLTNSPLSPETVQRFNQICHQRKGFTLPGNQYLLAFFDSPAFVDHGESPEVYENYTQAGVFLRKALKNKPFLETVLNRWNGAE